MDSIENKNVVEAKKCLNAHLKFIQALKKHINGTDPIMKGRALWASWCIHRYMNDTLVSDIEKAMIEYGGNEIKNNEDV